MTYTGQPLDLLGPRGREHESLTIWPNLTNNLADLGFETHVQHPVGLVENQIRDPAEVGPASLQHVNETTRGGNHNLDTTLQISNLRTFWCTAIDSSVPDTRVRSRKRVSRVSSEA